MIIKYMKLVHIESTFFCGLVIFEKKGDIINLEVII